MLRLFGAAIRGYSKISSNTTLTNISNVAKTTVIKTPVRHLNVGGIPLQYDICRMQQKSHATSALQLGSCLQSRLAVAGFVPLQIPCRTVTKFSRFRGKRKSVKTVPKRFYRLNWGIWIRTRAGRSRNQWRKSQSRRRRQRKHVFTNATQSYMLDKMVTKFWRRPKFFVDDPFTPYHTREEFPITRRKPLP